MLEGNRRLALLQSTAKDSRQEWLAMGEELEGWRLVAVAADHVRLAFTGPDQSAEATVMLYPPEAAKDDESGIAPAPENSPRP
ncbi:hypothetical protein GWI71_19800 [Microvirga tunisiensis]|uniref:Uncharacterized protein n=1 Tax=Pannonibacter tanglangensis TaxID=2750084 RepID=A0ABW9ZMI9_9HYPH|nr:hypothetical protein [Pannonibacter sp. XCT-34]